MYITYVTETPQPMNYTDVLQFFQTKSMKQDEMIEALKEQLYSNEYVFMEQIIEEYVLGLNETELNTLENSINANLID
jgi:hypothetical protein